MSLVDECGALNGTGKGQGGGDFKYKACLVVGCLVKSNGTLGMSDLENFFLIGVILLCQLLVLGWQVLALIFLREKSVLRVMTYLDENLDNSCINRVFASANVVLWETLVDYSYMYLM